MLLNSIEVSELKLELIYSMKSMDYIYCLDRM